MCPISVIMGSKLLSSQRPQVHIGAVRLYDSYHCSRYNTNTGKLTTEMFEAAFPELRQRLTRCARA